MPHREPAAEIEDVATAWAARAERGLTAEEQADLDHWLAGDSRRLGAFVRAQAAWIHAERATALGKMPEGEGPTPIDAVHLDASSRPRMMKRRAILGGGAAIAASAAAAAFVFGFERTRTLESGIGEIRHIALKDGSTLILDTDTRVDIVEASGDRALVLARGKIFLDVLNDAERALVVEAGDLILEMGGGAFGVEALPQMPLVALVTNGALAVRQKSGLFGRSGAVTVASGQQLTIPAGALLLKSDIRPVAAAQRDQLLAWRDGMLSFGGEALASAVRAFDRYGPVRIVITDPDLARQRITGLFKADDPRGFATAIAASFGGLVAAQGDVLRISAGKASDA